MITIIIIIIIIIAIVIIIILIIIIFFFFIFFMTLIITTPIRNHPVPSYEHTQLQRKIDKIAEQRAKEGAARLEVSPLEMERDALRDEIKATAAENAAMQQQWMQRQHECVVALAVCQRMMRKHRAFV